MLRIDQEKNENTLVAAQDNLLNFQRQQLALLTNSKTKASATAPSPSDATNVLNALGTPPSKLVADIAPTRDVTSAPVAANNDTDFGAYVTGVCAQASIANSAGATSVIATSVVANPVVANSAAKKLTMMRPKMIETFSFAGEFRRLTHLIVVAVLCSSCSTMLKSDARAKGRIWSEPCMPFSVWPILLAKRASTFAHCADCGDYRSGAATSANHDGYAGARICRRPHRVGLPRLSCILDLR